MGGGGSLGSWDHPAVKLQKKIALVSSDGRLYVLERSHKCGFLGDAEIHFLHAETQFVLFLKKISI